MGRGLDGFFVMPVWRCAVLKDPERRLSPFPVALARGKHLFPFRTEKLSPSAPMVLGPRGPGRVGRRRFVIAGRLRAARRRTARSGGPPTSRQACVSPALVCRDADVSSRRRLSRTPSEAACGCDTTQRRPAHGGAHRWLVLVDLPIDLVVVLEQKERAGEPHGAERALRECRCPH